MENNNQFALSENELAALEQRRRGRRGRSQPSAPSASATPRDSDEASDATKNGTAESTAVTSNKGGANNAAANINANGASANANINGKISASNDFEMNDDNSGSAIDGLAQYNTLFAAAFPESEYPVLTQLWKENVNNSSGTVVSSATEAFLTSPDTDSKVLQAAQKEVSDKWTNANIAERINSAFSDEKMAPFLQGLDADQRAAVGEMLRTQIISVLQDAIAEKKDALSAILQESVPWYDRQWQGLEYKYWAAIGAAVLFIIIVLIASGGKKAYNYYNRPPPVMMPPPVDPRYAQQTVPPYAY